MILKPDPTWFIQDATKVQAYMDCPRMYFYEYILGWRPTTPNIHLEFGKAWHLAMEHMLLCHHRDGEYTNTTIIEAWELLNNHYRSKFPLDMDAVYAPKNPEYALKALSQYAQMYKDEKFETIYTEIAGSVPISYNAEGKPVLLHFRMDSILRDPMGIKSREHKTGSTLNRQWSDQWALSMQTGVYNHVLHCLFPREEVWGVEINGTFFGKKDIKFQRVPARRTTKAMNVWLWNVNQWVDSILADIYHLGIASDEDEILPCFRMNTQSCTKYFGCRYHDFCMAWPNPLRNLDRLPEGMKIEFWNPMEAEQEAKHVFHVDELMKLEGE
jgi:hypothetical protein